MLNFFAIQPERLVSLLSGVRWVLWCLVLVLAGCKPAPVAGPPKYHCPMHPSVVSDKPGTCPICGMDLVPISQDHGGAPMVKSGVPGLAVVKIPAEKRQLMGLRLGTVEKRPVAREIRTSARIVADETKLWRVSTKIEGWVEQLYVGYTGQSVKKGDPLLSIYSPDLVSAQAEYLAALRAQRGMSGDGAKASNSLVASARRRLELWDISAEQIDRLTRSGTVEKTLTLYAPANGVVLERNVLAGQKIMQGNSLMVIADLSVVWGEADVYQSDMPFVHEGMSLELSLPYWPETTFSGKVIFVSPMLEEQSRTLKARLEIPNPQLLLKPGMYGDARLFYQLGERLTIPASAVMFGGERAYAFRDLGDGHVVPVAVKVGIRSGDNFVLLSGLNAGDQVVTSANFLVDSESNLKAALEVYSNAQPASHAAHALEPSLHEKTLPMYLRLGDALASDDFAKAKAAAKELDAAGVQNSGARAKDLEELRNAFRDLSETFIASAKQQNAHVYVFHCPMADDNRGARWMQSTSTKRNPYFGPRMLGCGDLQWEGEAPAKPADHVQTEGSAGASPSQGTGQP